LGDAYFSHKAYKIHLFVHAVYTNRSEAPVWDRAGADLSGKVVDQEQLLHRHFSLSLVDGWTDNHGCQQTLKLCLELLPM
jgi:hypothetical protein